MKHSRKTGIRILAVFLLIAIASGFMLTGLSALAEGALLPEAGGGTKNSAPIAKNLNYYTFKNIAIAGKLEAVDLEGDMISFKIASPPKKGGVILYDGGSFAYTPKDGKTGKDSFTYTAYDTSGNISEKATVSITIKKQATKTTYSDMDGNDAYYAALTLAEEGIFTGDKLGGEYFFRPEQNVTRGEFLAMCFNLCKAQPMSDVKKTGFYDDSNIPLWVKPYLGAAVMAGVVSGYKTDDGQTIFAASAPITYSEAAVILNNVLKITDVVPVGSFESEAAPEWAAVAVSNLSACSIMPRGISDMYSGCLTRADAAKMLLASDELVSARNGEFSLLGWAK